MPNRLKDGDQTKNDPLVLQVGLGTGLTTLPHKKCHVRETKNIYIIALCGSGMKSVVMMMMSFDYGS